MLLVYYKLRVSNISRGKYDNLITIIMKKSNHHRRIEKKQNAFISRPYAELNTLSIMN